MSSASKGIGDALLSSSTSSSPPSPLNGWSWDCYHRSSHRLMSLLWPGKARAWLSLCGLCDIAHEVRFASGRLKRKHSSLVIDRRYQVQRSDPAATRYMARRVGIVILKMRENKPAAEVAKHQTDGLVDRRVRQRRDKSQQPPASQEPRPRTLEG